MKADFWASAKCYQGAIQMTLASNTTVAQKELVAEASALLKDNLSVPATDATPAPNIRSTEETKKVSLDLPDMRKMATISSSLNVE